MRHLIKTILFLSIGFAVFLFIESRLEVSPVGKEIYKVLKLSKRPHHCSEVIIGDSVGRQLFNIGKQGKTLCLTSNQAISMVGQYILIANYVKANPGKLRKIFFVIHPLMFGNNLDQTFTFNYFFLPFFSSEYDDYFSTLVLTHIKRYKYFFIARLPWAKTFIRKHLDFFPVDYSKLIEKSHYFRGPHLSPITSEYLKKLQSLCMEHNIRICLVSPPLKKKFVTDLTFMKSQIKENGLEEMFSGYFADFIVLDNRAFRDEVHLKHSYLKQGRASVLKKMKRCTCPGSDKRPGGFFSRKPPP